VVGSTAMQDKDIALLGAGLLLEAAAVPWLGRSINKVLPKMPSTSSKVLAAAILSLPLIALGVWGRPNMATAMVAIQHVIPYVAIWVWAMGAYLIWEKTLENKKQIAVAFARFDLLDAHVSEMMVLAFKYAKNTAENETLKLDGKWVEKDRETQQKLHKQWMEFQDKVNVLKSIIDKSSALHEQIFNLNNFVAVVVAKLKARGIDLEL